MQDLITSMEKNNEKLYQRHLSRTFSTEPLSSLKQASNRRNIKPESKQSQYLSVQYRLKLKINNQLSQGEHIDILALIIS